MFAAEQCKIKTPPAEDTARRFARNFRTYSAAAEVQKHSADALVELLAATSGGREFSATTELGCGTGLLTRAYRRCFPSGRLHLFDLAANCQDFLEDVAYDSFTVADLDRIERLPPAELVISSSCLQWIKDPLRLFQTINASLAEGGIFAAASFSEGNLRELSLCGGDPLPCPSTETWRRFLVQSGFAVKRLAAQTQTLRFPDALAVLRHLKQTGTLLRAARSLRQTRRFLERYDALAQDGSVTLTYTPILWIAEKQRSV